jgi:hypothetical protein
LQPHGAQEPNDAEQMIGVIVGEENLLKREPDAVAHHLALGPFPTVEQDRLAFSLHSETGHVPVDGGDCGASAEEGEGEHGREGIVKQGKRER